MFKNKMIVKPHSIRFWLGFILREAGEVLENLGCFLQGSLAYKEQLNRSRRVMNFQKYQPQIGVNVFISPSCSVIGNVHLGEKSSVWYNTILRGDVNKITIGELTNVQDRVVVHGSSEKEDERPCLVGNRVTIESGVILHACKIEDEVIVGIGATVLDGAVVATQAMVAPGSVVSPGTKIPSGQLWAGVPAKFVRDLTSEERKSIAKNAQKFFELAQIHKQETSKEFQRIEKEKEEDKYRDDKLAHYRYDGEHPVESFVKK